MSGEEFKKNKVAIIGAGVIGSGWILRFLLNGWDVHVYDLDLTVKKDISELYSDTKPLISSIYKNTNNYEGKLTYFNKLYQLCPNFFVLERCCSCELVTGVDGV